MRVRFGNMPTSGVGLAASIPNVAVAAVYDVFCLNYCDRHIGRNGPPVFRWYIITPLPWMISSPVSDPFHSAIGNAMQ